MKTVSVSWEMPTVLYFMIIWNLSPSCFFQSWIFRDGLMWQQLTFFINNFKIMVLSVKMSMIVTFLVKHESWNSSAFYDHSKLFTFFQSWIFRDGLMWQQLTFFINNFKIMVLSVKMSMIVTFLVKHESWNSSAFYDHSKLFTFFQSWMILWWTDDVTTVSFFVNKFQIIVFQW